MYRVTAGGPAIHTVEIIYESLGPEDAVGLSLNFTNLSKIIRNVAIQREVSITVTQCVNFGRERGEGERERKRGGERERERGRERERERKREGGREEGREKEREGERERERGGERGEREREKERKREGGRERERGYHSLLLYLIHRRLLLPMRLHALLSVMVMLIAR